MQLVLHFYLAEEFTSANIISQPVPKLNDTQIHRSMNFLTPSLQTQKQDTEYDRERSPM
jgi:hypothetical protein